jgi:hypothetical protein
MKIQTSIAVMLISAAFGITAVADECASTCEQEYSDCKASAESAAAKQACEDDVKQCKADCK